MPSLYNSGFILEDLTDFSELAKLVNFNLRLNSDQGWTLYWNKVCKGERWKTAIFYNLNFGKISASNVTVFSMVSDKMLSRDEFLKDKSNEFRLYPLLPSMEKRYWIFIDNDKIVKINEGTSELFVSMYFSYSFLSGYSSHGIMSKFDKKTKTFIHNDM